MKIPALNGDLKQAKYIDDNYKVITYEDCGY